METHILLFFVALFCLIVYLARILVFIIFTGKRFHLLSLSLAKTRRTNVASKHRVRGERKSQRRESQKQEEAVRELS